MSRRVELRPAEPLAAELFLAALYRSAPSRSLVELRFRTVSGMRRRLIEWTGWIVLLRPFARWRLAPMCM